MTPSLPPHLRDSIEKKFRVKWFTGSEWSPDSQTAKAISENSKQYKLELDGYLAGYQQAYSDLIAELGPVVEALEFYGEHEHWKTIEHCESESKIRIDAKDFDAEIYEGRLVFHAGKISREALKHLKERILNDTK